MENRNNFTKAFLYAADLHQNQNRKGSDTPYISHLMAVASIVMRFGGDDEDVIAALLHDAVEDQGGQAIRNEIEHSYGKRVADIVIACSDTDQIPKPPWKERKLAYLTHLRNSDASALMVSAADKLHNALDCVASFDETGDQLWNIFHATKEETRWYYQQLMLIYQERASEFPRLQPLLRQTTAAIQLFIDKTNSGD